MVTTRYFSKNVASLNSASFFSRFLIFIFAAFSLTACSPAENASSKTGTIGTMSVAGKVAGEAFTSLHGYARLERDAAGLDIAIIYFGNGTKASCADSSSKDTSIAVSLSFPRRAGAFDQTISSSAYRNSNGTARFESHTITITEIGSNTIAGTFEATTGEDKISGAFSVPVCN